MTNWIKGKINWYDEYSGHGSIISEDNVWYCIHEFTNLDPRIEVGSKVKFLLTNSSIHPIVTDVIALPTI